MQPDSTTLQYDSLVKQYVAALDLQTQKTIAGKIETLLLQETPIVYPVLDRRPDRINPHRRRAQPDVDRAALPQHRVHELRPQRTRTWSSSSSSVSAWR